MSQGIAIFVRVEDSLEPSSFNPPKIVFSSGDPTWIEFSKNIDLNTFALFKRFRVGSGIKWSIPFCTSDGHTSKVVQELYKFFDLAQGFYFVAVPSVKRELKNNGIWIPIFVEYTSNTEDVWSDISPANREYLLRISKLEFQKQHWTSFESKFIPSIKTQLLLGKILSPKQEDTLINILKKYSRPPNPPKRKTTATNCLVLFDYYNLNI